MRRVDTEGEGWGATDDDLRDVEARGSDDCTDSGRVGEGTDCGRVLEGVSGVCEA